MWVSGWVRGTWVPICIYISRWLGHAPRKPNDVMVKQLLFAHSIPGHPRPLGRPHLTWMDTCHA